MSLEDQETLDSLVRRYGTRELLCEMAGALNRKAAHSSGKEGQAGLFAEALRLLYIGERWS